MVPSGLVVCAFYMGGRVATFLLFNTSTTKIMIPLTFRIRSTVAMVALVLPCVSEGATLVALPTFGGGDGTLVPADYGGGTANNERQMAFNPATGNIALVSRQTSNRVDIINGTTGAPVKTMTAPVGGAYTSAVLNITGVGISQDGQIFTSNLADGSNGTAANRLLSVYRWSGESSTDPAAVSSYTLTTGIRLGDAMDAYGTGASASVMLGVNDTVGATVHPGDDGFAILNPFTSESFTLMDAASGSISSAFRLTSAFVDGDTAIGNQNGVTRVAEFSPTGITSITTVTGPGTTERHADVVTIGGVQYLATLASLDATVRNRVSIWELNGTTATLLTQANLLGVGTVTNPNGTGDIDWGNVSGDSATLYALTTNHGIQAFMFTVPEPGVAMLGVVTALGMAVRRRRA